MADVTNLGTKKPFEVWTVKNVDYKLRLTAGDIQALELKYNKSIIELFTGNGMPPVYTMLDILHMSMQKFQHGIDRKDVNAIYDDYLEEGGNIQEFYMKTFLGIAVVSGFFTEKLIQTIQEDLSKL